MSRQKILEDALWTQDHSSGEECYLRWFRGKVIGKTEKPGMLWGTWYIVVISFDMLNGPVSCSSSFANYCRDSVGDSAFWLLSSKDGKSWEPAQSEYNQLPPKPRETL